ncbi:zinc finger MYM-type protein 1 [Folsomia candida]|uniref:zinc finger MYM-type protein 1 n=1 Tax=Folsomia candida TaxID=158441 RepID=UPI001604BDC8|nr:zinc finger MYM-type protein 1 [Folsomia candida]
MGTISNPNLKPISARKEESGASKKKKRKINNEKTAKLADAAAKFFKLDSSSTPESETLSNDTERQSGDPDAADVPISSASDTALEVQENQGETDSGVRGFEIYENAFIASDPSTWNNPLKSGERSQLMSNRPLQEIPKQGEQGSVSFNVSQYNKIGSNPNNPNELYARDWLLYSVSTNSLFCYCCSLFARIDSRKTQSPWINFGIGNSGFNDFVHQSRRIKGHEESQMHFQALICWRQSEKASRSGNSLEKLATAEMQKGIHHWKQVLHCIVDAILYLAKNNLAFRGSSSQIHDDNSGNFLSLIELLSKYSPALAIHVNNLSKNRTSYLSPSIQNEFISIAGENIRREILKHIKSRKFFSIMFDATPDISHREQISEIIRTVKISKDGCYIEENFIRFISFDGKTGEQLTKMIVDTLKNDDLDIGMCRGQGYDNGSNMAGMYKGVQARVKEINPKAICIPCAAHSLNLVGHNAVNKVPAAKLLLGQIQNLYTFFSASPSRWTILKKHTKKTLKAQSHTRWSCKYDAVSALLEEFDGVYEALLELAESSEVNAQTSLQKKDMEVDAGAKHLRCLLDWLNEFRVNGYDKSLEKAKARASEIGVNCNSGFDYRASRGNRPSRYRDGVQNPPTQSNEETFKSEFFQKIMDQIIDEIRSRFQTLQQVASDFSFLWGHKLETYSSEEMKKNVMDLVKSYGNDFVGETFLREVEHLKRAISAFLDKPLQKTMPLDILNVLTANGLQEQFINCHTALRIFLTLPVTVATNERSFSKLKIINNYLRSSMGQERLSDLSIISIEHNYVKDMSFDKIIDDFAVAKCRNVQF